MKNRIAFPGKGKRSSVRTLLATNRDDQWFSVFGFENNERDNITALEMATLKKLAKDLLGLSATQIAVATKENFYWRSNMKRGQHKSRLLSAVHETAQDLHKVGFIDKRRMREYDVLCLEPVSDYSAEQIRSL